MHFAAWLKSMSSSSACQEPWFGRKTTERLVRPQVGGVVWNEVPGRVLAYQYLWLSCLESNPCWEAHVGSSRDWFCSWSCRSLLYLTTFPGVSQAHGLLCGFSDGKVLAWSEQDHDGWPPTLCMGVLYIYALVCCKSNMLH